MWLEYDVEPAATPSVLYDLSLSMSFDSCWKEDAFDLSAMCVSLSTTKITSG